MKPESYDTSRFFDAPVQVGVTCGTVDLLEILGITQHITGPEELRLQTQIELP